MVKTALIDNVAITDACKTKYIHLAVNDCFHGFRNFFLVRQGVAIIKRRQTFQRQDMILGNINRLYCTPARLITDVVIDTLRPKGGPKDPQLCEYLKWVYKSCYKVGSNIKNI